MNIIKQSAATLSPKTVYDLTKNPSAGKMTDVRGTTLEIVAWAYYETETASGEISEIVAVLTQDGEVYRTNSKPFIREFADIVGIFPDANPLLVTVQSGRSKNNREFIYAVYAGE